jgi:hypothetical protein
MLSAIDPLTAAGVVLATAATDAIYVMFTSAVVARRRIPAATWSSIWYLLSSSPSSTTQRIGFMWALPPPAPGSAPSPPSASCIGQPADRRSGPRPNSFSLEFFGYATVP